MRARFIKLFSIIILLITFHSCTSVYEQMYPTLTDGLYDSEFPYRNSSKQLEEISQSIKLLNSIAFYTSYIFDDKSSYTRNELEKLDFEKTAVQKVFFNRTSSGTATVIDVGQDNVVLLTVAHIVNFPDTIISYFVNPNGSFSNNVQSISIKSSQSNYIPDLSSNRNLEILLMDNNRDIALLGKRISRAEALNLRQFNFSWGKSSELEWGSFIYVFGFPMNFKMISKGIVSSPNKDKNSFLIDAVFNRGYSGGIVLAIRDGVPNFELVGLVKSVPADYEYTIRPITKEHDIDFNPMLPYKGEIYVDKEQALRLGITKVIGIENVTELIENNVDLLHRQGYYIRSIVQKKTPTFERIK